MRLGLLVIAVSAVSAGAATAQDAMEVQRAVWRCQHNARDIGLKGKAQDVFVDKCIADAEAALKGNPKATLTKKGTVRISGSVSYPSDYIPDLIVCAEPVGGGPETCATYRQGGRSPHYQIQVSPGEYYVYAKLKDAKKVGAPDFATYKAYYSEFVTCGQDAKCPSHKPIVVDVRAGKAAQKVDPQDWYK